MKHRLLLSFALFFFTLSLRAQDFEIVSVESLPADFSAREEIKADHSDRQCALLRIATQNITPNQREGFSFVPDLGSEVVERATRDGEIWLWVSPGLKYLRIKHREWGQYELRMPDYVARVEALHTYKVVIRGTFKESDPDPRPTPTQQYLVFQLSPTNAVLEVDGYLWEVAQDGSAMKFVDFGTYSYRVQAPNYHTATGTVTVNDPENTQTVPVSLRPDFVEVTLKVDADAEIWVNNEKKGTRAWTGSLGKGTYKIECKQESHETTTTTQPITDDMNGRTITLPVPKPVYGSLNVESTPNFAKLYIDGKAMGETPKYIAEILIGQHEIKLTKEGYQDYTETVTITKGERKQVKVTFSNKPDEETFTVNGVSFTMKRVEGGIFRMGSDDSEAWGDEKPVHSVTVSTFHMGETEVTQALWKAVMGSNPSYFKGDNLPVEQVSWNDCQEFIRKLNSLTGKNFRLPTEAEWEYAARGGSRSNRTKYAGSRSIGSVAWYTDNSGSKTHPVKGKSPNELGLYDMSGNVWEWCGDWYGKSYYSNSPSSDPKGPSTGSRRVLRGGGWNYRAGGCRVSNRHYGTPVSRYDYFGFRLVLPQ